MLNPFPIQFLAPLAYFLLRVVLGIIFLKKGSALWKMEPRTWRMQILGGVQMITGVMFFLGFYTQIAALLGLLLSLYIYLFLRDTHTFPRSLSVLMAAASVSLFITGAGPFAFDLPI